MADGLGGLGLIGPTVYPAAENRSHVIALAPREPAGTRSIPRRYAWGARVSRDSRQKCKAT
jgi:hypothetical protein